MQSDTQLLILASELAQAAAKILQAKAREKSDHKESTAYLWLSLGIGRPRVRYKTGLSDWTVRKIQKRVKAAAQARAAK